MKHSDDIALVERVLKKDQHAFNDFFDVYFARLFRFCQSRVSEERICEDLVQETLCKAIRNLSQYRGEASLFTWLCQICRNEIHSWYRKNDNKIPLSSSLDDNDLIRASLESLSQATYDESLERDTLEKSVQLVLDYLPNNYGKVLEWKYLEELSVNEIADRLKTSNIAAQSLLARARKAFRQGFNELSQDISVASSTLSR